ncbi:RNA polymerase II subunit A C-terminal domain phosphatase [Chelonus insularis]|uniref:RNA polymerase II subunit A C-terminal domain phosphatase n=1 Tax=Chelonus insularis TaxID=460826 RepID=UPI00158CD38E|nr:RNA polymerase II subunit A C-terminal domain phosphatase [Chelonus insularis]
MASIQVTFSSNEKPGKLKKWRVAVGTMISAGRVLFLYHPVNANNEEEKAEKKFRATQFGKITEILIKEGEILQPGQVVLHMTGCKHPTVMKDLCAECGADLRQEDGNTSIITKASVPMIHSIPELKVCPELAEKIGKEDEQRLLKDKKLALLVDLDQTIVHTTNDNVPAIMKDVFHYQLYGPNSPWYHTRLRPGTRRFLEEMSKLYELHICTFGARNYAHTVAALLDKEGKLFSHRILSRDECFNPASKTANLKALFPCGDDLVCIIDDREDVWQGCGNLVQVKPYHFFRHTGDIHAPPGLEKRDPEISETETSTTIDPVKQITIVEEETSSNEYGITTTDSTKQEDIKANNDNDNENDSEKNVQVNYSQTVPIIESSVPIDENVTENNIENTVTTSESLKTEKTPSIEEENKSEDNKDNVKDVPLSDSNDDAQKKEEVVEDKDNDDYLLYLEDILRRIHTEFYKCFDNQERKPLKVIIPLVRARVLKGLYLTFSGLIPTHQKLEQSRAYKVAKAFGAEVTQEITEKTTHLVAIKPGTAKANTAKKNPNIKIVNPDWLWSCAERWEHVDERLFPLTSKARGSRIPPPHCSSPDRIEIKEDEISNDFASSINPLMSFSPEEIAIMDKEVDEDMSDAEMDGDGDPENLVNEEELGSFIENNSDDSSDSNDNLSGPTEKRRKVQDDDDDNNSSEGEKKVPKCIDDEYYDEDDADDDDDEDPVTRFRRGESLPDDLDLGEYASQDSVEIDDPVEEDDDREWNAMGAALEREFLSD